MTATPSTRQQRVGDLIHQQIAILFKKEVHDPRLRAVSFTAVSASPDLKRATVYYTLLNSAEKQTVAKVLTKSAGYLRRLLSQSTVLRYTPQLHFKYDESVERGNLVSALIDDAIRHDVQNDTNDERDK